jgi:hypothetical protein
MASPQQNQPQNNTSLQNEITQLQNEEMKLQTLQKRLTEQIHFLLIEETILKLKIQNHNSHSSH